MNKKITPLLCLLFCIPMVVHAQKLGDKHNILKISTLHFFDQTFLVGYERMNKAQTSSFELDAGITAANTGQNKIGFMIEPHFKKYFYSRFKDSIPNRPLALRGVYGSPYILYRYMQVTQYELVYNNFYTQYKAHDQFYSSTGLGTTIGFVFDIFQTVYVDLNFGGGIKFTNSKGETDWIKDNGVLAPGYSGIYPKVGISLGTFF